jgi:hypothetical protein
MIEAYHKQSLIKATFMYGYQYVETTGKERESDERDACPDSSKKIRI